MPGQQQREKSVRRKLNAIDLEFRGKNVLLVDDSIVRGTTSGADHRPRARGRREEGVLRLRRAAGALPERVRHRHAGDERAGRRRAARSRKWRKLIGADWLVYQDLDDLVSACRHDDAQVTEFDTSCFSGEYVTGDVTPEYLARLQRERSDEAKTLRREGRRGTAQSRAEDPDGASDHAVCPRDCVVGPARGAALLLHLFQASARRRVDGRRCCDVRR